MRALHTIYFHFLFKHSSHFSFFNHQFKIISSITNGLWSIFCGPRLILVLYICFFFVYLYLCTFFLHLQNNFQTEDMSPVKSALTYGLILPKFHHIGLSIQCVNSTTASGIQNIFMCVDNPNFQSLTCMLAKPLHLYNNNFNYLSACWTSLC